MTDTDKILFPSRFGIENKPLIDSDFPESARTALWFVLRRTVELKRSEGWYRIAEELLRLHRVKKSYENDEALDLSYNILHQLEWTRVYIFCERVYEMLLTEEIEYDYNGNPETVRELEEVRRDFERDINQLLGELAYHLGVSVRDHHNLFACQVYGIKGVQEFFLSGWFAGQEVNVVDSQQLRLSHSAAESLQLSCLQGQHKLIDKILR